MFNNSKSIDQILLENTDNYNSHISSSLSSKNIPKEVDDYYQNKVQELSDEMIKNHKEFIEKEKDIFQSILDKFKYSKETVDAQYKILNSKYSLYNKYVYGSIKDHIDQSLVFLLNKNKDIKFQRDIIQKFIDEKHIDIKYEKFDVEPIAFSTCLLPSADTIIKTGLESDDGINPWFMDENRVIERMINELQLYTKNEILTSEEIIKRYDKYIIDIKKYYKHYLEYNNTLKHELQSYITKKQNFYEGELKKANGNAKQFLLNKLQKLMDRYFVVSKIAILHYNIQLKFLFESFKACARMVQKPYDYLIKNYGDNT